MSRSTGQILVATIRPRHWIKNSFILAPALFTLRIFDPSLWWVLLSGTFGFCLVASAVYTFNDIMNRAEDRQHPHKRFRPLASGELSVGRGVALWLLLLALGIGLLWGAGGTAWMMGVGYALLMTAYTLYLRRLLIVDVIIIAIGFVLRVLSGALLIGEPASQWLLLCTFTLALFFGMTKRRQEIVALRSASDEAGNSNATRPVLAQYPEVEIISGWINILGGMAVLCYALYSVDPVTVAKHNTGALVYTLPFVLYGVFRYQQLALGGRRGEDPTSLVINDLGIRLTVLLWAITVGVILYMARG